MWGKRYEISVNGLFSEVLIFYYFFFFFFAIIYLSMKITRTYNTFFPMILKVVKQ